MNAIIVLIIVHVFFPIDEHYMYDQRLGREQHVLLEVFEIYNELIRDLQQAPGVQDSYLDTEDKPDIGTHVKVSWIKFKPKDTVPV